LNKIWDEGEILSEWRKGLLRCMAKKGDVSYCKTWRVMMMSSVTTKVLSRVILNRLRGGLEKNRLDLERGGVAETTLPPSVS